MTTAAAKATADATVKANESMAKDPPPVSQESVATSSATTKTRKSKSHQKQKKKDKKETQPTVFDDEMEDIEVDNEGANDNEEEEDDEEQGLFITRFWDGNMPTAIGKVGASANGNMCTQLQGALDLLRFLSKEPKEFNLLDLETTLVPFLLAVPGQGQRNVRVLYGLGSGAGATGIRENELKDSFLALSGEYIDGVSLPTVMTLPNNIVDVHTFKVPTHEEFEKARLQPQQKVTSWFKAA